MNDDTLIFELDRARVFTDRYLYNNFLKYPDSTQKAYKAVMLEIQKELIGDYRLLIDYMAGRVIYMSCNSNGTILPNPKHIVGKVILDSLHIPDEHIKEFILLLEYGISVAEEKGGVSEEFLTKVKGWVRDE